MFDLNFELFYGEFMNEELLIALKNSYEKYESSGARCTAKLKPLHLYFAQLLGKTWGDNYQIHFMGEHSKEKKVDGKYYPKDSDITITQNG